MTDKENAVSIGLLGEFVASPVGSNPSWPPAITQSRGRLTPQCGETNDVANLLAVDQKAKWAERGDRKDLVCH